MSQVLPDGVDQETAIRVVLEYTERAQSLTAVANATGLNWRVVRRVLLAAGVQIRKKGPAPRVWSDEVLTQVTARVKARESVRKIAADIGVPEATLRIKLADLGVRSRYHLTPAETAQIVDRYTRGESIQQVADHMGRSRETVRYALVKEKVPLRTARTAPRASRRWPAGTLETAVARRKAGESVARIAADLGIPTTSLRPILRRAGITSGPRPNWLTDRLRADILARYEQGQSERQIARAIRRSRDAVRRVLDDAQVPRRTPRWAAGGKGATP